MPVTIIAAQCITTRATAEKKAEAKMNKTTLALEAAVQSLGIAYRTLLEKGQFGAEEANIFATHAVDSLRGYLEGNGIRADFLPEEEEEIGTYYEDGVEQMQAA